MKVMYLGYDQQHGVYDVVKPLLNGSLKLKGKLFPGHEFIAKINEVRDPTLPDCRNRLSHVNPSRGAFTIVDTQHFRDADGTPNFLLLDAGAYPVHIKGFPDDKKAKLTIERGKLVKDAWTVLENWQASPYGSTIGSGWIEFEDGTVEYYPGERYNLSAGDRLPKAAYRHHKVEYEEMTLF